MMIKYVLIVLNNDESNECLNEYETLEDQYFYSQLVERIENDDGTRYPADEVVEKDEYNPFDELTDEELFD